MMEYTPSAMDWSAAELTAAERASREQSCDLLLQNSKTYLSVRLSPENLAWLRSQTMGPSEAVELAVTTMRDGETR